ncbi:MAG: aromatic ring-opening dioxygenase LigA [Acidimicrobiia bacterium]|jgi:hypothetical protein
MRKAASIAAIALGALMIVGAAVTWFTVSSTLATQNIVIGEDAAKYCWWDMSGRQVDGPFTSFCQAQIIDAHALEATGGLYYSEIPRDDPLRAVAASAAYLQTSLFTSVVAFGVAAMAGLMGVVFILIGLGMRDVAERTGAIPARA